MRRPTGLEIESTILIHFRGSDMPGFTITERKSQPPLLDGSTPGVVGRPVDVQGVVGAWGTGSNLYLEWNKDGLNFTIQAAPEVGLDRDTLLSIANSIEPDDS